MGFSGPPRFPPAARETGQQPLGVPQYPPTFPSGVGGYQHHPPHHPAIPNPFQHRAGMGEMRPPVDFGGSPPYPHNPPNLADNLNSTPPAGQISGGGQSDRRLIFKTTPGTRASTRGQEGSAGGRE